MRSIFGFLAIVLFSSSVHAEFTAKGCAAIRAQLREGDIVFTRIDNWLYRKVAEASKAWTTHVGIAIKENGNWLVAESTIPLSKKTEFCDFLGRTANGQYSVRRLRVGQLDLAKLKNSIDANMYRPYDLHFDFDSTWLFCSKFVYEAYLSAAGVEIGRIETLGDLRAANPEADQTFWEYWFLGNVPWQQRTVTPQSQYEDAKLVTVSEQL